MTDGLSHFEKPWALGYVEMLNNHMESRILFARLGGCLKNTNISRLILCLFMVLDSATAFADWSQNYSLVEDFVFANTVKYYASNAEAESACAAAYLASPFARGRPIGNCGPASIHGFAVSQFQEWTEAGGSVKYGSPDYLTYSNVICAQTEARPTMSSCHINYFVGGAKCPNGYFLDATNTKCEARCLLGQTWDPVLGCQDEPEEQTCKNVGPNPIDYMTGRKYRTEFVISTGGIHPVTLEYYYNNHGNHERTVGSIVPNRNLGSHTFVASHLPPMNQETFLALYYASGLPKDGTVQPDQFYGDITRYWRHSFDEIIQIRGNTYYYYNAKGARIAFTGFGSSQAYPTLRLARLADGEEAFTGYKLRDDKAKVKKIFDETGKLRKIVRGPADVLTLTYESNVILKKITNSQGASLELFSNSFNDGTGFSPPYPTAVRSSDGTSVELQWKPQPYTGRTGQFYLLSRITDPAIGQSVAARDFEYGDSRWPVSLTDIFTVNNIATSERELYAHFEYDDLGRAVISGLANGKELTKVDYLDLDTRTVTNALGKEASYEFAVLSGARRLLRITGEPTQNCVSSEVAYDYDTKGNVRRKTQNHQVTEYQYDSQNREISRTEAEGTAEGRTIMTEYHPTLNLPIRITEPDRVEEMTYDDAGRLISRKVLPTGAN